MGPICGQDIVVGHQPTQESDICVRKIIMLSHWGLFASKTILIENTTFNLNLSSSSQWFMKIYFITTESHSWKQPCLYILLSSIQNEKIDTLWNKKWYRYQTWRFYVERFIFFLTNLHFLVPASWAIEGEKHCIKKSSLAKCLIWCVFLYQFSRYLFYYFIYGSKIGGRQNQSWPPFGSFSFLRIRVENSKEKVFAFALYTNVLQKGKRIEENLLEAFRCKLLLCLTSEGTRSSQK